MNTSQPSAPTGAPTGIPAAELAALQNALGTDLLGTFCGLILYGVIIHQFYRYCRAFPSDLWFIRVLIVSVLILETGHTAMTMHYPYVFLITNFGNPGALAVGTWSVNINSLLAALIILFSQVFFIRRIYTIGTHYRIIATIATILSISEIPIAIYIVHTLFKNTIQNDLRTAKWLIGTSLLVPTIVDTLLTSALILVLRKTRAGLKRNDSIASLVVVYGINTGFLHWILNFSAFLSFIAVSDPFTSEQYGAINIVTDRVYAITFLCVLNSREAKSSVAIFDSGTYGLKVIEHTNRRAAAETWHVPHIPDNDPAINISVTTELENGRNWDGPKKHRDETSSSDLDCPL